MPTPSYTQYTIICGYYGYLNEDGMNYVCMAQEILELAEIGWGQMQDITNVSNDPQDGRRVWQCLFEQSAVNILEEYADLIEFV